MSQPNRINGLFTLHITDNNQLINLHTEIPRQDTLVLRQCRVYMTTAAMSLSKGIVYVDLPFVQNSAIVDQVESSSLMSILLGNDAVTLHDTHLPVPMSRHVPAVFRVKVFYEDGTLVPDNEMISMTLKFSYEAGYFR